MLAAIKLEAKIKLVNQDNYIKRYYYINMKFTCKKQKFYFIKADKYF